MVTPRSVRLPSGALLQLARDDVRVLSGGWCAYLAQVVRPLRFRGCWLPLLQRVEASLEPSGVLAELPVVEERQGGLFRSRESARARLADMVFVEGLA